MRYLFLLVLLGTLAVVAAPAVQGRSDIIIADFEGKDYGNWRTTGTAFGSGPAQGGFKNQMPVTGFEGHGLVDSYNGEDDATGTLTSPEFTIGRKYINFLIGGGKHPGLTCINLLVDGKIVRTATGPNGDPGGTERLDWATWDVSNLLGKTAVLEIVDNAKGSWGHINIDQITLSDARKAEDVKTDVLYSETYRPQFHFSAKSGWLNDPNGLVYYDGEYHLFFQHNPFGLTSGNLSWGHAVSRDLTHWTQIANAITPDKFGPIWSGSAIVDKDNTTGFKQGSESPIIAIYTAAGGTSPESKGVPFAQRLVFSVDKGRTFTIYAQNPVLPHIVGEDRDPRLVWFAPAHKWIMALYLEGEDYALFSSPDIKQWTRIQTVHFPGSGECPDFFEMPIEKSNGAHRWVFTGANGHYLIGSFDGVKFTPTVGPTTADYGSNTYAVQTWSNIPSTDGRRIQITWMAGGSYPHMPFNQQMSYPCELTLNMTDNGLRIWRWPVKEIASLYDKAQTWQNVTVQPGGSSVGSTAGDLWDIQAEFELGDAKAFGIRARGENVRYDVAEQAVTALGRRAPLMPSHNRVTLRLLVDRTSLEVFGNRGEASLTSCFLPRLQDLGWSVFSEGGAVNLVSLTAHPLHSAWTTSSK